MKKSLLVLAMVVSIVAFFVGCGKTESPLDIVGDGALQDLVNLGDITGTQPVIDPNDPEAIAKMMESYAEIGAEMELQAFDDIEAVDAPSGFPSSLLYPDGKITGFSDNSYDTYLSLGVTIQTTDDSKEVKDFYKNLQAPWKITSQSSDAYGASYSVTEASGFEASVDLSFDQYSKLVTIYISYSGTVVD